MQFEDSIKFKTGDIVTYKQDANTPVGKMNTPIEMTCLYIIRDFYPDTYWNRREGQPGDSHNYELINIITNHKITALQYQICFASERIDSIVEKAEDYLIQLKFIRDELLDSSK